MDGSIINGLASTAVFLLFLHILVLAASNSKHGHGGAVASPSLIIVELHGHDDKTYVAVQKKDISIAGFTDEGGHWHAFPGREHLFPASTTLPFALANLPEVPLGREVMMQAVRVLSAYYPGADVEPVKRALAVVQVMLSQAQRPEPIRETINDGWDIGARAVPDDLP